MSQNRCLVASDRFSDFHFFVNFYGNFYPSIDPVIHDEYLGVCTIKNRAKELGLQLGNVFL